MGLRFWKRESGPTTVDAELREMIISRFRTAAADIDKMYVLRRAGQYVGRPVTQIRVYDPAMLTGELEEVKKYRHLDTQVQAVCFEGHAEKDHPISLRSKGCMEKTKTAA